MDFEITSRIPLNGNSEELIIKIDKSNLQLLGYILETVEGMCHYTTVDKSEETLLKIVYTLDFKNDIDNILRSLQEHQE